MNEITLKRRIERSLLHALRFLDNAQTVSELLDDEQLLSQVQAARASTDAATKAVKGRIESHDR